VHTICTIIPFDSFVKLLVPGRVPILHPIVLAIDGLLLGRLSVKSRFFNIVTSYDIVTSYVGVDI
jgi:hypothetical protein